MHSSRMRAGRSLTVSQSLHPGGGLLLGGVCSGGVSAPGRGGCLLWGEGVFAPEGCLLLGGVCSGGVSAGGVSASGGGVCSRGVCSQGVSAPGGCLLQGGMSTPGQHALRQTPPC